VLTLLFAFVFTETLHFTEDMVIERQLRRLSEQFQTTHPNWQGQQPIKFYDAMVYPNISQLPPSIRTSLPKDHLGVTEVSQNNEELAVLTLDTDSGKQYIVMNIAALEIKEEDDFLVTLMFAAFTSITLIISLYVVHITAGRLSRPLNQVTDIISKHDHLSTDTFKSIDNAPMELNMLVGELVHLQERVDQHIERERQFTSFASHELRTPLAIIKAAADLLQINGSTEKTHYQHQQLHKSIQDMEALIDTFLRLGREKKSENYRIISLDEPRLLSAAKRFEHLLSMRKLSVNVSAKGSICIESPETVINVLLNNLIKNAITYSADGIINLTISNNTLSVTNPCLPANLAADTEEMPLEIRQHGIGLNIVSKICDYFDWKFSFDNSGQTANASITFS
jgi:signal transduction histidine kinase